MAGLRYDVLDGDGARSLAEQVRDLYAEVYAEPPYNEGPEHLARFVEHFAEEVGRPGFVLARVVDGARLAGVAYGWTMAAGRWFGKATAEPPAEVRDAPKFAVMEWILRGPYRGSGAGRRLLDLVLTGRPEPWAVLASNPDAPARRVYEHLGWQQVGVTEAGLLPSMDILALRLPGR